MEKAYKNNRILHEDLFSFFSNSFLSFFSFSDRRIDIIKEKLNRQKEAEAIKQDWMIIGTDLKNALPKSKPKEVPEDCEEPSPA